jgi:hypothetical protein
MSTIQRGELSTTHALYLIAGIFQEYLVVGEERGRGRGLGLKNEGGHNLTTLQQGGVQNDKNRPYINPFKKLVR